MSISETQIPQWLNTQHERIHIVWDWEIVPREYLPVFNSNVIDLYIPRIEGLSERYLYACDDYIVMRNLKPEDFFTENEIMLVMRQYQFPDCNYARTIMNSGQLICPQYTYKKDGHYYAPYCNHAIVPHMKSENLMVLKKYQKEIEASLSRFREDKNLTWLIYSLNLMMKGLMQRGNLITSYNALVDENSISNLDLHNCDVIVLNDEYRGDFNCGKPLLMNRLEEVLSSKSEFEK